MQKHKRVFFSKNFEFRFCCICLWLNAVFRCFGFTSGFVVPVVSLSFPMANFEEGREGSNYLRITPVSSARDKIEVGLGSIKKKA